MNDVNEIQVGGQHYKTEYQHWDFVLDTNQDYLIGNATKYVARHAKKNGREDLLKAHHYINKALSLHDGSPSMLCATHAATHARLLGLFCDRNGLGAFEHEIIRLLVCGGSREHLLGAGVAVRQLMERVYIDPAEPTPGYVDQG